MFRYALQLRIAGMNQALEIGVQLACNRRVMNNASFGRFWDIFWDAISLVSVSLRVPRTSRAQDSRRVRRVAMDNGQWLAMGKY